MFLGSDLSFVEIVVSRRTHAVSGGEKTLKNFTFECIPVRISHKTCFTVYDLYSTRIFVRLVDLHVNYIIPRVLFGLGHNIYKCLNFENSSLSSVMGLYLMLEICQ